MLYNSICISLSEFNEAFKEGNWTDWEYKKVGEVVYLRKNIDGELNLTDKGWKQI